ncbi:MAG: acyltransferase family protein [Propioniciclava sp.]
MSTGRNHVIDVARAASIVVVVVYHGLLYRIDLTPVGVTVEPWAAPSGLYPLTWLLMILPLFFVAGGFGHSLTVDRIVSTGGNYASFLGTRAVRLVGPLRLFVTFSAVASTAAALAIGVDDVADLSQRFMVLLWFVAVYLVIIALAPAMVRLHDRAGVWPLLVLGAAALVIDAVTFGSERWGLLNLNFVVVWLFVHQLGIAYQRGWFRRGPAATARLAVLGGLAAVAALVLGGDYPPSAVAFADLQLANAQPPTSAMAALAVAQCGMLGMVERSGRLAQLSDRSERRLRLTNALMVTTYLWHLLGIILAGAVLVAMTIGLPALAPLFLHQLVVAGAGVVLTALMVPAIARLELRLTPAIGAHDPGPGVLVSYGMLLIGVIGLWGAGAVALPSTPVSLAAVLLVLAGGTLLGRSLAPRETSPSVTQ